MCFALFMTDFHSLGFARHKLCMMIIRRDKKSQQIAEMREFFIASFKRGEVYFSASRLCRKCLSVLDIAKFGANTYSRRKLVEENLSNYNCLFYCKTTFMHGKYQKTSCVPSKFQ